MRTEGKISIIAICEKCNGIILASHIDYMNKQIVEVFKELANEGFTVKLESIEETKTRKFATYKKCKIGACLLASLA